MSGSRHFFARGTFSNDQVKNEIKDDIASARSVQRDLQAAGQHGPAARMGQDTDEYLDELNDANRGRWSPRHA